MARRSRPMDPGARRRLRAIAGRADPARGSVHKGRRPQTRQAFEHRVSAEESFESVWSADGRELFFQARDDTGLETIKVVSITTEPDLVIGKPQALFSGQFLQDSRFLNRMG